MYVNLNDFQAIHANFEGNQAMCLVMINKFKDNS